MKRFIKSEIWKKLLIGLLLVITICFCIPQRVYAGKVVQTITKELLQMLADIGDVATSLLNRWMVGTQWGDTFLSTKDVNLTNPDSWLYAENLEATHKIEKTDGSFLGTVQVPNIIYAPEAIFANNIAALDVNFLNPNKYTSIIEGDDNAEKKAKSMAEQLSATIATWYRSFRNIAIVVLLTILVYLGIRIVISSTAGEKAKYKESIKDWIVAICLVFFIHIIMSGILMITEKFTDVLASASDDKIVVQMVDQDGIKYNTNLMGLARSYSFSKGDDDQNEAIGNALVYLVLVVYLVKFTITYYKRFLYVAFLTMISPLVAITYPVDKAGDGKAQAFNMWFREYLMNIIIQPVHMLLYTVLVGSAISVAANNPIYALVAIGFLIPAEKFIKEMFGLNKAKTQAASLGGFAGGALAAQAFNSLKGKAQTSANKIGGAGGSGGGNRLNSPGSGSGVDVGGGGAPSLGDAFDSNTGPATPNGDNRILSPEEEQRRLQEQIEADRQREAMENYLRQQGEDPEAGRQGSAMEYLLNQDDEGIDPALAGATGAALAATLPNDENIQPQFNTDNNNLQNANLQNANPQNANPQNANPQEPDYEVPSYTRSRLMKPLKTVGKKAFKLAGTSLGTAMGALGGLAIGAASGDPSKAVQSMVAGGAAGNVFARVAGNAPKKAMPAYESLRDYASDVQYASDIKKYGREVADSNRQEREMNIQKDRFMKNSAEKEKAEALRRKIGDKNRNVTTEQIMESMFDYRYKGIDEDMAKKAIEYEAEEKQKDGKGLSIEDNDTIHKEALAVAKLSKNYGAEYITDTKKKDALKSNINNQLAGKIGDDAQRQRETERIMGIKAKMHGIKYYG